MKTFWGGTLATIGTWTLGNWNHAVGIAVGLATLACLIPVAVSRWRKMLRGESQPPFEG